MTRRMLLAIGCVAVVVGLVGTAPQAAMAAPDTTGTIYGTVYDAAGRTVSDAVVTFYYRDSMRQIATAKTDGRGKFKVDGLSSAEYVVTAQAPRIGFGRTTVKLLPGASTEIKVTLSRTGR